MIKSVYRMNYIPGDQWIYYRFYAGHEIADKMLQYNLLQFLFEMEEQGIVNKWFFIRYADPEKHLRLRVMLSDMNFIPCLIRNVNMALEPYVEAGLVWKVEIGTYQPEYERYGRRSMPSVERLFHADSIAFGKFLLSGLSNHENALWLYAIYSADRLLEDFGFSPGKKKDLLLNLSRNFGREFGKDKFIAGKLSDKFRQNRRLIDQIIRGDDQSEIASAIRKIIQERSVFQKADVKKIKRLLAKYAEVEETDLLSSLIHMSMNRVFNNNNRLHEMVIYDLLFRHYKSAIAQLMNVY
jgi:thiopeptide-type bacteriocin biosynthesis protein